MPSRIIRCPYTIMNSFSVVGALTSVAVFVPLGVLIPLLKRRPLWWKVLLTVVPVSLTIELLELSAERLISGGYVADVDDFMWDTAGVVGSEAIFVALIRVPILSVVLDKCR